MSNVTQKSVDISQNRLKLDTFFDICNQKRNNDTKIRENPGKYKNLGKMCPKVQIVMCEKYTPNFGVPKTSPKPGEFRNSPFEPKETG